MRTITAMFYVTTIIICILLLKLEKQEELLTRQQNIITKQSEMINQCINSLSIGAKIVTYNKENGE